MTLNYASERNGVRPKTRRKHRAACLCNEYVGTNDDDLIAYGDIPIGNLLEARKLDVKVELTGNCGGSISLSFFVSDVAKMDESEPQKYVISVHIGAWTEAKIGADTSPGICFRLHSLTTKTCC